MVHVGHWNAESAGDVEHSAVLMSSMTRTRGLGKNKPVIVVVEHAEGWASRASAATSTDSRQLTLAWWEKRKQETDWPIVLTCSSLASRVLWRMSKRAAWKTIRFAPYRPDDVVTILRQLQPDASLATRARAAAMTGGDVRAAAHVTAGWTTGVAAEAAARSDLFDAARTVMTQSLTADILAEYVGGNTDVKFMCWEHAPMAYAQHGPHVLRKLAEDRHIWSLMGDHPLVPLEWTQRHWTAAERTQMSSAHLQFPQTMRPRAPVAPASEESDATLLTAAFSERTIPRTTTGRYRSVAWAMERSADKWDMVALYTKDERG